MARFSALEIRPCGLVQFILVGENGRMGCVIRWKPKVLHGRAGWNKVIHELYRQMNPYRADNWYPTINCQPIQCPTPQHLCTLKCQGRSVDNFSVSGVGRVIQQGNFYAVRLSPGLQLFQPLIHSNHVRGDPIHDQSFKSKVVSLRSTLHPITP